MTLAINCWWPRRPLWLAEDEWAVEAWERMTFGGVVVDRVDESFSVNVYPVYLPPYVADRDSQWLYVHGRDDEQPTT